MLKKLKAKKWLGNFFPKIRSQIIYMVFFSLAFVLMGKFIPEIYFTYFDTHEYYSMELPVKVDKPEYLPGEDVKLKIKRTSDVDMDAFSIVELILIDQDTKTEAYRVRRDLSVNKGYDEFSIVFTLPDKLQDGKYFYQGTVNFDYRGIQKHFNFYTNTFLVDEPEVKS